MLEIVSAAELGIDMAPRHQLLKVTEPPTRKAGVKVGSVAELLEKLRAHEGIEL